jgi:LCP family protein required for cell wall assembly
MAYLQRTQKDSNKPSRPITGQDIIAPKKKPNFPSVGMTLPSYSKSTLPPPVASAKTVKVKPPKKKWNWVKRISIGFLVILLIGGVWLGGKFIYNAQKLFGGSLLGILQTTKLKGEDTGRVNILLAGNSADDVGHNGAELTDSIMILSIDPVNKTAYTLSVPRDLYVEVGDDGFQKINSAYVTGEVNEFSENTYPAGGMGQLEQVIEDNFGVNLHYFALVNYNALRQAVDAVGGIDFTVKSSDKRGLFDPNIDYTNNKPLVKLPNGVSKLNGQQALNLARARGDSSRAYGFPMGDFDRANNQRAMLIALKTKAVSAGVLSNPAKLSSLADAIGDNVTTDLKVDEVKRLYEITKDINNASIKSVSLNDADGVNLLANFQTPNGASALIPAAGRTDFSDIQSFLKRLNSRDPVVREAAKVVVLNATDTSGLAGLARTKLLAKNINVVDVGDAKANQATTTIIDLTTTTTAKPGTRKILSTNFGTSITTTNPYGEQYDADFIIVLGANEIPKLIEKEL